MLANFQFQVRVQLAAGKMLLVIVLCVGSPTSLAQHAHAHFHPSTLTTATRYSIRILASAGCPKLGFQWYFIRLLQPDMTFWVWFGR